MNTIIAVFQLKHLILKTPRLEIYKIDGDITKYVQILI